MLSNHGKWASLIASMNKDINKTRIFLSSRMTSKYNASANSEVKSTGVTDGGWQMDKTPIETDQQLDWQTNEWIDMQYTCIDTVPTNV